VSLRLTRIETECPCCEGAGTLELHSPGLVPLGKVPCCHCAETGKVLTDLVVEPAWRSPLE